MKGNVKYYFLPIAFLLFLGVHLMDECFLLFPEPPLKEQRVPAENPALNWGHLDPYPGQFEAYYNDHFKWRNFMIRAGSYLNYYTFKKSSLPEKVIIGQEDWLFKGGHQLALYQGKFQFSKQQLTEIAKTLERRRLQVEAVGGKYYLTIPPLKHHIYPEYLPDRIRQLNPITAKDQLISYLAKHTNVAYIDLLPPILERKQKENVLLFHRTDHHWTPVTALMAAGVIVDHLRQDFPALGRISENDFRFTEVEYPGMTLAQLLGIEEETSEKYLLVQPKIDYQAKSIEKHYLPPTDFPFPEEYILSRTTGKKELPTLFMVRESFANHFWEILGEEFEESTFLFDNWKHEFNGDIFQEQPSDIYIQCVWEGLIVNLLEEPPKEARW